MEGTWRASAASSLSGKKVVSDVSPLRSLSPMFPASVGLNSFSQQAASPFICVTPYGSFAPRFQSGFPEGFNAFYPSSLAPGNTTQKPAAAVGDSAERENINAGVHVRETLKTNGPIREESRRSPFQTPPRAMGDSNNEESDPSPLNSASYINIDQPIPLRSFPMGSTPEGDQAAENRLKQQRRRTREEGEGSGQQRRRPRVARDHSPPPEQPPVEPVLHQLRATLNFQVNYPFLSQISQGEQLRYPAHSPNFISRWHEIRYMSSFQNKKINVYKYPTQWDEWGYDIYQYVTHQGWLQFFNNMHETYHDRMIRVALANAYVTRDGEGYNFHTYVGEQSILITASMLNNFLRVPLLGRINYQTDHWPAGEFTKAVCLGQLGVPEEDWHKLSRQVRLPEEAHATALFVSRCLLGKATKHTSDLDIIVTHHLINNVQLNLGHLIIHAWIEACRTKHQSICFGNILLAYLCREDFAVPGSVVRSAPFDASVFRKMRAQYARLQQQGQQAVAEEEEEEEEEEEQQQQQPEEQPGFGLGFGQFAGPQQPEQPPPGYVTQAAFDALSEEVHLHRQETAALRQETESHRQETGFLRTMIEKLQKTVEDLIACVRRSPTRD